MKPKKIIDPKYYGDNIIESKLRDRLVGDDYIPSEGTYAEILSRLTDEDKQFLRQAHGLGKDGFQSRMARDIALGMLLEETRYPKPNLLITLGKRGANEGYAEPPEASIGRDLYKTMVPIKRDFKPSPIVKQKLRPLQPIIDAMPDRAPLEEEYVPFDRDFALALIADVLKDKKANVPYGNGKFPPYGKPK